MPLQTPVFAYHFMLNQVYDFKKKPLKQYRLSIWSAILGAGVRVLTTLDMCNFLVSPSVSPKMYSVIKTFKNHWFNALNKCSEADDI